MNEIDQLRSKLTHYERNATKTSWLLKQIGRKIRYFPRDSLRRLRRSMRKRAYKFASHSLIKHSNCGEQRFPFIAHPEYGEHLKALEKSDMASRKSLASIQEFMFSDEMRRLVQNAAALEPDIGAPIGVENSLCPPWNDLNYHRLRQATKVIPRETYGSVILMPAGRMGGADLVAAILAQALAKHERVLILRTDDTHWDRPDWYPDEVVSVDISEFLRAIEHPSQALYVILGEIGAPRIFNVNSRLAFETYATYGARLATQFKLYAYYFCADRTEQGIEIGYPVSYFSNIFRYLTAAMIDSSYLAHIFKDRFAIPPDEGTKLKVIYTPAQLKLPETPVAEPQVARAKGRRPCILWGGRLDRQKRFDLAVAVARVMPDVDFHCWGKAVLDKPPELGNLPENLILNPPFKNYEELPLTDCDGWLYTSFWDGLPTILIELGALGMPIVASAVGGVPELIDESTGWLFDPRADAGEVAKQIRAMLADPAERVVRATALQQRVRDRHSMESYIAAIRSI